MSARLPDTVRTLILNSIDSVGQLELLLLLHSSSPKSWTSEQAALEMRSTSASARKHLETLRQHGLVIRLDSGEGGYFFDRSVSAHGVVVDELAAIYPHFKVAIITLIYEKPLEKLRGFTDAFKIRKDD